MKILSIILSFILGFLTYPVSYITTDKNYNIEDGNIYSDTVTLNEKITIDINENYFKWFNYYGICYSSDSYIKGELCYLAGVAVKTESFFLEPGEDITFYSFINNCLNGTKANSLQYVSFEPLNTDSAQLTVNGISLFNRSIPDDELYIEDQNIKIGVDLLWGGALSYLEDLNSNVQAVEVDGHIYVDSDASERYSAESVNNNVNLINRNDTGRLVQQSYYGTFGDDNYTGSYYGENQWAYNPVQGGNQYNDNSKIVDVQVEDDSIYIKCQPLDWAKEKEYITPSYMEAYYTIENGMLHVSCRFVDFSGYTPTIATQEIPAFYCIEPLNNYVYYSGDEPWTNGELTYKNDLIFWPDAGYPKFTSSENWSAFVGQSEDSFGIGLYVPDETEFLTGVYARGETTNKKPDEDSPTSYIAVVKDMEFMSFTPFEYDYFIATGNVNEIRASFDTIE